VLNQIERRRGEASYVKTAGGFEVDFLVRDLNGRRELIQVCADPSSPGTIVDSASFGWGYSEHRR